MKFICLQPLNFFSMMVMNQMNKKVHEKQVRLRINKPIREASISCPEHTFLSTL